MAGITLFTANNLANFDNSIHTERKTPYEAQQSFATALKESINSVNEAQVASDNITNRMANGENVDLHTVMIAAQKAGITMSATLEVRNKVVEAYQEIMRMNI